MQYFTKFKEVARQAISAAAEVLSPATLGITPRRRPAEEFLTSFQSACDIIDRLANAENASSPEADYELFESQVILGSLTIFPRYIRVVSHLVNMESPFSIACSLFICQY